ncbi:hypothetical protein [Halioxenophilus sp. WMMB6]|uniref:hypothetical protein n=1 Tax=Halioxenophilus sp. WMMB6 TaxID=3073815 RepID=UPI00295E2900|nr:hypothetical protein [Halioxenophilus sp. WMMB6]
MVRIVSGLLFLLLPLPLWAEVQVSAGWQIYEVGYDAGDSELGASEPDDSGYTLTAVAHRQFGQQGNHYFGTGITVADILGDTMLGFRAMDYQYEWASRYRAGMFFGAASLDSGSSQSGYYFGFNFSVLNLGVEGLDAAFEYTHGDGLGRDTLFADDPQIEKPDFFLDFNTLSLSISYRFK